MDLWVFFVGVWELRVHILMYIAFTYTGAIERIIVLTQHIHTYTHTHIHTYTQVLLDGFSCYNATDVSGKTALDYARSHPQKWREFEGMFSTTTADGMAYMVRGDMIAAR